jgi:serine/threonine protein kinase
MMKFRPGRKFSTEAECARLFYQLMSAIEYMHTQEISHRDIKMENILIEARTGKVKVIDFGFSCQCKDRLKIFCGTPSYMSPEIVSKKEYYGGPADIWACGVLLYTLLCGTFPFKSITTEKELFRKINRGIFSVADSFTYEIKDLLKSMLNVEPSERPTATMILSHPWFKITGCVKPAIGVKSLMSCGNGDSSSNDMAENTTQEEVTPNTLSE